MFARNGATRLLSSVRLSAAQQAIIAGPSTQPIAFAASGRCAAHLSTTAEAQAAVATDAHASSSTFEDDSKVHVKLSYLDPRTKPEAPASATRSSTASIVPLSSHVFGLEPRADVMHSAVVYYLDKQRMGTASTKTRGETNYSGRKLRPQKGSGRARLGNRGNPLLRGGGVIFGPRPRDMSSKLPRRVRELALRSALSARWQEGNLHVIPSFQWIDPPRSTGALRQLLGSKGWSDTLFLTAPRHPGPSPRSLVTDARPSASDPVYTLQQRRSHRKSLQNFLAAVSNIPRTEVIELDDLTDEAREQSKTSPKMRSIKRRADEAKAPGELHAYEVLLRKKVVLDLGALEWLEEKLGGSAWHAMDEAEMRDTLEAYGTALAEEGWQAEAEGEAEGEAAVEAEKGAKTEVKAEASIEKQAPKAPAGNVASA